MDRILIWRMPAKLYVIIRISTLRAQIYILNRLNLRITIIKKKLFRKIENKDTININF